MAKERYIQSIELENFQSHVRLQLDLAAAGELTILTGATHSGKSAVVRALGWVLLNTWRPVYMRQGCDYTQVTLTYSGGLAIIRRRSRSGAVNRYTVMSSDGDTQVYEGFGTGVPAEIQALTGVRPVEVAGMTLTLNVAGQLETSFLGAQSISGPARAKILGKLAGTEEVDVAGQLVGTDLARANRERRQLEEDVAKLEIQVNELAWVPELGQKIKQLEQLFEQLQSLHQRRERLCGLRDQLTDANRRIDRGYEYLARYDELELAEAFLADAGQYWERARRIAETARQLSDVSARHSRLSERWMELSAVDEAAKVITTADSLIDRATQLRPLSSRLHNLGLQESMTRKLLAKVRDADKTAAVVDKAASLKMRVTKLRELSSSLQTVEDGRQHSTEMLEWAERGVQAGDIVQAAEKLNLLKCRIIALKNTSSDLADRRECASMRFETAVEDETKAREQYRNLLLAAGTCPVCGADIKDDLAEHLREVV